MKMIYKACMAVHPKDVSFWIIVSHIVAASVAVGIWQLLKVKSNSYTECHDRPAWQNNRHFGICLMSSAVLCSIWPPDRSDKQNGPERKAADLFNIDQKNISRIGYYRREAIGDAYFSLLMSWISMHCNHRFIKQPDWICSFQNQTDDTDRQARRWAHFIDDANCTYHTTHRLFLSVIWVGLLWPY